jgi:acetolactate synthase-1/2/3 large subunit
MPALKSVSAIPALRKCISSPRWTASPGCAASCACSKASLPGAADGYARMAGKPAATLLHLGPGFGNAISFLHNARKAHQPVINIVGDHATSHSRYAQAPLTSDIMAICGSVSDWLHQSRAVEEVAGDGARALQAAKQGQIATLVLPADCAWNQALGSVPPLPAISLRKVEGPAIDRAAAALKNGRKTGLLMRGACLERRGLDAAGRIAQHSGARLLHDYFTPRMTRGEGLPEVERIPYFSEQIVECLEGLEQIILVGAPPPVTFFAYPDKPSWVTPEGCDLITLAGEREDATGALESLADALGAKKPDVPSTRDTRHAGACGAGCFQHGGDHGPVDARQCHPVRRFPHGRAGAASVPQIRALSRLAGADRRRHRRCAAHGGGRRAGLPGPQGDHSVG